MNIDIKNTFWKDLKKIIDPTLKEQVENIILAVEEAQTMKDIPNLKKLKGFKVSYRIRAGDYRIGLTIENHMATFAVFKHRKDIYKFFP